MTGLHRGRAGGRSFRCRERPRGADLERASYGAPSYPSSSTYGSNYTRCRSRLKEYLLVPNDTPSFAVRSTDLLVLFFLAAVFSFRQSSLFMQYHGPGIHDLDLATVGFFNGETHWRAYQNRLLGPGLILLVQKAFCFTGRSCDYDEALKLYYYAATYAANMIFLFLAIRIRRDVVFGFFCLMSFIGFQIMMWDYWYYPWDPLEMIFFSILLLMDVKKKQGMPFFYTLFLFWVFSKETAIFIPFWLLLTRGAVSGSWRSLRGWWTLNRKIALHAAAMLAIAAAVVRTLRDRMFVQSVLPGVGADEDNRHFGNMFTLFDNLDRIRSLLSQLTHFKSGGYGSVYVATYTGVFLYAVWCFWKYRTALPPLAVRTFLFAALYFGFVMMSGVMAEARVYLPLAPMVLTLYLAKRGDARWTFPHRRRPGA
jgi:hypothetical protein